MSMRQTEASAWHVVGGWNHVQPGAACRVELPGAEIALWRTEAGAVHAWDNRCPHRGMRLSFGIVKGDRLACRYHGWHYDEGGQCRFIPAHPNLDPPDTLAVAQHATHEQDEAIWVALGAGPTEPPPPLGTDQPGFCRSIPLPFGADTAADVLMRLAGASPVAPRLMQVRPEIGGSNRTVTLAVQPIDETRAAMHVFLDGGPKADARLAAIRWTVGLRWQITSETGAAA
ncbi:MAG: Rieske [2Fe-2S] domain [Rhodobacteraceae bacterium HLUCCO18]|nr:MAG: Rieske [2Fe-2S] domain [Rhodobacteraceae bacterium HLUCCO18]